MASESAAQHAEAARQVAEFSADAYVNTVVSGGVPLTEDLLRQAFVDGYMTAIETLLTMAEARNVR